MEFPYLLGWNESYEQMIDEAIPHDQLGRIVGENRALFWVATRDGEVTMTIPGKMRHEASSKEDLPHVGDWVLFEKDIIKRVLPRSSLLTRKEVGIRDVQVLATNVDVVFILTSLNQDFNVRRLERYLALVEESGTKPVFVLTKTDLVESTEVFEDELRKLSPRTPVFCVSTKRKQGLELFQPYLVQGKTAILLGSSGVGKSSLINTFLGQEMLFTQEIREGDGRGKHSTTGRHLLKLPTGGVIIDSPGMREIGLWVSEESVDRAFTDITDLMTQCRFTNCLHQTEPGCAVKNALKTGALDEARFESYEKLRQEVAFYARRNDKKATSDEKKKWKKVAMQLRQKKDEQ